MQSLIITANSAWSTLLICDRQGRKDFGKVVRFGSIVVNVLTSRQAIQTYRMIWNAFTICCMVAIFLGTTAREFLDGYVEDCLKEEAIGMTAPQIADEPVPAVEEVAIALTVEIVADAVKAVKRVTAIAPSLKLALIGKAAIIHQLVPVIFKLLSQRMPRTL